VLDPAAGRLPSLIRERPSASSAASPVP